MTDTGSNTSGRLLSLDFFRGTTILAMILVNNPGSWSNVYAPLLHAKWHGWTFTDLIFPFFLFIVGVAIVYAFSKRVSSGAPKLDLYKKIIRRTLILFGLGLFLSGFPYFDLSTIRIMGVLQRIALCYLFASIIFLHTSWKGQLGWAIGLMLAYWAMMEWIPVPGVGAGMYDKGANFAAYIDNMFLEGHMWSVSKTWDPEGLISTLPAISTTLLGVLTGHWMRSEKSQTEKTLGLFISGNFLMFIASIWAWVLPINKSIWTSSYTLMMGGLALICLGFSYYFIDVRGGSKKWLKPSLVYGTNAITVFVLSGIFAKLLYLITFTQADGSAISLKGWIYQNLYASWLSDINASLGFAITFIIIMYLLMLILYKKKIFIKI
jgi:predicted acyltransferase